MNNFIQALYENLKTSDKITTALGDFVVCKQPGISGRNPRTGEEIKTPGKYFYYFFPSEYFVKELFAGSDTKKILETVKAETIQRIEKRFGEFIEPKQIKQIEIDPKTVSEMISKLKTDKRIELKTAEVSGEIKISNLTILFSAVGQFT